jgi:two-component system chemotaxis response regulator CheY
MMTSILAVDDSAAMRQMVNVALTGAGYQVTQAVDGLEALRIAAQQTFDLVITDVNMPNMDGITLVRELRGRPEYKRVPLLVLTTEATAERKQEGKTAGATGWLVKPFNPAKLLAAIAKVVG